MRIYKGITSTKNLVPHQDKFLNKIVTFKEFPVFMGCVDTPRSQDWHSDMIWTSSESTVLVKPLIDSSFIYQFNHNDSVGKTWTLHHESFAKFVNKHALGNNIYEIGGAHGMLQVSSSKEKNFKWVLHDINPVPVAQYQGKIITGKFNRASYFAESKTQTIVHSHTLEHVNDQVQFLSDTNAVQQKGERLIFSVPNMDKMLLNVDLNFLNFEHNRYLPQRLIMEMLEKTGYKIIDKYEFLQHSVFYACELDQKIDENTNISLNDAYDKERFDEYFQKLDEYVNEANLTLKRSKYPTYIFGAHVFTQMLIAAGVQEKMLQGCLDNSLLKIGKRLYGTNLKVYSPSEIIKKDQPMTVVGAVAQYKDEIIDQFLSLGMESANIFLFGGQNDS